MRMSISGFALIFVFVITSYADTTFVEGDVQGDWDINGSPYIVGFAGASVVNGGVLNIEPGVRVLFNDVSFLLARNASIIANGTEEDSIYFGRSGIAEEGQEPTTWVGILNQRSGSMELSYCIIDYAWGMDGGEFDGAIFSGDGADTLRIRNCLFRNCLQGISSQAGGETTIEGCNFIDCLQDIWIWPAMTTLVRNCIFIDEVEYGPLVTLMARQLFTVRIENCYFGEETLDANGEVLVSQCIFLGGRIRQPWGAGDRQYVFRNSFSGRDNEDYFYEGRDPEGPANLGIADTTNFNGDSCDAYGNIFLDPLLAGGEDYPDRYFLTEDSPCIDAGDPDSPLDPDSTFADIGPFFFSQPNIAISADSFAFAETPVGSIDTLIFSIRNRGDQKDLRYFIDEEALGRAFWVPGWGGDTASLSAGESVELALIFRPEAPEEFLDTLRITSNDRDEGVIVLPVRGVAANSIVNDVEAGRMRRSVLLSVSPNPFNSTLTISFRAGSAARPTRLSIYDLSGREVARLLEEQAVNPLGLTEESPTVNPRGLTAYTKTVTWNASSVPAGVYLVRLQAGQEVSTKKVVLIR